VTFTPAEPQLTPAGQRRFREGADLKSAAEFGYHRGPGTLRAGLLLAGAPGTAPPGEQVHGKDKS
jgi:hypothetical protein